MHLVTYDIREEQRFVEEAMLKARASYCQLCSFGFARDPTDHAIADSNTGKSRQHACFRESTLLSWQCVEEVATGVHYDEFS